MSSQPKRKAPAFQLYADDFLAGTMDMTQQEVGAYIRLLCHQWCRGMLPACAEKMQRVAGGIVSADVLAKFPVCEDGNRRNSRLEQVRADSDAFRRMQSEKASKRWNSPKQPTPPGNAAAYPAEDAPASVRDMPGTCSPSPSPSPVLIPSELPEGSGEQELPLEEQKRPKAPRKRNELLDVLLSECGIENPTKTQFSMGNKFLAEIKEVDPEVTPQQIRLFCSQKRSEWRGLDFTPAAVAKHWKAPCSPGNGHSTVEPTPDNPFPGTGPVTLSQIHARFSDNRERYRWMMEMDDQGRFQNG
jgi:hypothetical protein